MSMGEEMNERRGRDSLGDGQQMIEEIERRVIGEVKEFFRNTR